MSNPKDMNLTPEEKRLQEKLRAMPEMTPDEVTRARMRQRFMTGEIDPDRSTPHESPTAGKRSRTWLRLIAALLPVAFALFYVTRNQEPAWKTHYAQGEGTVAVDGVAHPVTSSGLNAALVPGARVVTSEDALVEVKLGQTLLLGVIPNSDIVLPSLEKGDSEIYLGAVNGGELLIQTGPDFAGRGFHILTAEGRVEITGTIVAINKMPDLTCVCVLEGTALIGKDEQDLESVPAGQRKVMFADDRPSMIVDIQPDHQRDLMEFQERNRDGFRE